MLEEPGFKTLCFTDPLHLQRNRIDRLLKMIDASACLLETGDFLCGRAAARTPEIIGGSADQQRDDVADGVHRLAHHRGIDQATNIYDGVDRRAYPPERPLSWTQEEALPIQMYGSDHAGVSRRQRRQPKSDLTTNRTLAGRSASRRMYQRYHAAP